MVESFPITMQVNGRGWKLMAELPKIPKDQNLFDLIVNDRNFLDLDFIMPDEYHLKTLQGEIILNDVTFLDKN